MAEMQAWRSEGALNALWPLAVTQTVAGPPQLEALKQSPRRPGARDLLSST